MHALALTLLLAALPVRLNLCAQPVPHHIDGIAELPNGTITLSLDGNVSNMFSLSGAI